MGSAGGVWHGVGAVCCGEVARVSAVTITCARLFASVLWCDDSGLNTDVICENLVVEFGTLLYFGWIIAKRHLVFVRVVSVLVTSLVGSFISVTGIRIRDRRHRKGT